MQPVPAAVNEETMGQQRRSVKRRRLSMPRLPIQSFSSFARSISLARSAAASKSRAHKLSLASKPSEAGFIDTNSRSTIKRAESSDEEDQQETAIVQADFGFFDPKAGDFNGVKLLLQSFLDHKPWDLSGFVDLILEQTTVGTVVKLDNPEEEEEDGNGGDADEGLYAVISALNLKRYAGHQCIMELKEYLLDVCSDESTRKKLNSLLKEQAGDVGLLVSQRFVNCPHQLVPPLYDALFDEVSWATEDEPTEELRDFFRFKFYLLVTKIYMNKNVNQRKARPDRDCDDPVIYIKAEDEIFHELSTLSFTFRLHTEQLAPQEQLKNYREMGLVMVLKADKVPKFRSKLKSLLDDS